MGNKYQVQKWLEHYVKSNKKVLVILYLTLKFILFAPIPVSPT